jgi:hypothetical protein
MMNQEQTGPSPARGGIFGLFLGWQYAYDGRSDVQCARGRIQLDDKPFQGIVEIQLE